MSWSAGHGAFKDWRLTAWGPFVAGGAREASTHSTWPGLGSASVSNGLHVAIVPIGINHRPPKAASPANVSGAEEGRRY